MGKRLKKIFVNELVQHTAELQGRTLNVVLKSNQTFFGRCTKIENQLLHLQDLRKHLHLLAFTQIESVIYDESAMY
ncbi:MAG: hypothetical protein ACK4GN_17085 [Runella sp.]